jgi:RimJ/RimL family protein N-acetyltransferase
MSPTEFPLQPEQLANDLVKMVPLSQNDFERLYQVASDPLIWEQHPNSDRYQREAFANYFAGAMASGSAFLVLDAQTGAVIGCTRFYDLDPANSTVAIGFTFLARSHWGGPVNRAMKQLLLDHAFQCVDAVLFHVGPTNLRSQKAVLKIGGRKIREFERAIGGTPSPYFEYEIRREAMPVVG